MKTIALFEAQVMANVVEDDTRRDELDSRPLKKARVTENEQNDTREQDGAEGSNQVRGSEIEVDDVEEQEYVAEVPEPTRASDLYLDTVWPSTTLHVLTIIQGCDR